MRQITIDGLSLHDDASCYVIAEIGHNHQGSVAKCKELFKSAHDCGVQAVKLQKRHNRSLYTREMYDKPYENENSFGPTYGAHREALEFGRDDYVELQRYARDLGITFFATAFDIPSADFLSDLEMPAYKLASGDLKNTPLLTHVAEFGKPMIISTGGASMADVERAYAAITPINRQLCILQCTAGYPAKFEELDLRVISTYRERFPEAVVGLSSHDNGIAMATAAYVLGARVVEKHFTLNRTARGTDHAFSLEPVGMRKMVRDLERTRVALGKAEKTTYPSEEAPILKMGKKLVAARDLSTGHVLAAEDIAFKSPGDGVAPYLFPQIVGRTLLKSLRADEPIALATLGQGESE